MADGAAAVDVFSEVIDKAWAERVAAIHDLCSTGVRFNECISRQVCGMSIRDNTRIHIDEPKSMISDMAWAFVKSLCERAEGCFAASGGRLVIETEQFRDLVYARGGHDDRRSTTILRSDFLPSSVWAALRERYEGSGVAESYKRAANGLWRAFWLERNAEVKRVGGCVELPLRVWTEPCYRSNAMIELSWNCRDSLTKEIASLECFIVWSGVERVSECVSAIDALRRGPMFGQPFKSRDRIGCAWLNFTLFKSEIKVRMSAELGDKLSEFFAEYRDVKD